MTTEIITVTIPEAGQRRIISDIDGVRVVATGNGLIVEVPAVVKPRPNSIPVQPNTSSSYRSEGLPHGRG